MYMYIYIYIYIYQTNVHFQTRKELGQVYLLLNNDTSSVHEILRADAQQILHWTAFVSLVFLVSALEHQVISHCLPLCFVVLEFNMTPTPSPSAHVLMTPFVQISDWWTRRFELDLPKGVKGLSAPPRSTWTSLSHLQLPCLVDGLPWHLSTNLKPCFLPGRLPVQCLGREN